MKKIFANRIRNYFGLFQIEKKVDILQDSLLTLANKINETSIRPVSQSMFPSEKLFRELHLNEVCHITECEKGLLSDEFSLMTTQYLVSLLTPIGTTSSYCVLLGSYDKSFIQILNKHHVVTSMVITPCVSGISQILFDGIEWYHAQINSIAPLIPRESDWLVMNNPFIASLLLRNAAILKGIITRLKTRIILPVKIRTESLNELCKTSDYYRDDQKNVFYYDDLWIRRRLHDAGLLEVTSFLNAHASKTTRFSYGDAPYDIYKSHVTAKILPGTEYSEIIYIGSRLPQAERLE